MFRDHIVVREWFEHPHNLAVAEEMMIAKLESRTRDILAHMRGNVSVMEAKFGETVEMPDGSTFVTGLIAERMVGGIRLIFTLLRDDESAIYANPPGDYQGGYHYIIGAYAKLFEGCIRGINWEAGSFAIVVDVY